MEMVLAKPNTKETMLSMVSERNLKVLIQRLSNRDYSVDNMDLTRHLAIWSENKLPLFKIFGGKLKLEKEVEFTLSSRDVERRVDRFIQDNLVGKDEFMFLRALFRQFLSISEIAANSLSRDINIFGRKVQQGMKITRLMSECVKKEHLHDIQTKFSMLIQEFKVKGRAVLSIDPIDYITMSENKSGWTSCHRVSGEYRAGALAYMLDGVTAIAYVTTGETVGDDISYENKNWRQVVYFEKDAALQARHYPAHNKINETAISELIAQAFASIGLTTQVEEIRSGESNHWVQDNNTYGDVLWYNDLLQGGHSSVLVSHKGKDRTKAIVVGTDVPCLCGCKRWVSESDTYYSDNCREDEDYDDEDDDY